MNGESNVPWEGIGKLIWSANTKLHEMIGNIRGYHLIEGVTGRILERICKRLHAKDDFITPRPGLLDINGIWMKCLECLYKTTGRILLQF